MDRFAFVIHPLTARDVARKYGLMRLLPDRAVEAIISRMSPKYVSTITGIRSKQGVEIEGMLVGCPLTSRQLIEGDPEKVLQRIIETCRLAEARGAQIVGLGAFTSVVGDAGISIARALNIPVTTGNSYTVATALQALMHAAQLMGIDPKQATAGVLGAAGSIGRVCSQYLSTRVRELVLIGLDTDPLEDVARSFGEGACPTTISRDSHAALPECDLVVSVTSAVDTVVEPEDLKRGAVVCDVARPRDISRRVAQERDDVLVIEGGVVRVPGENVDFHFDFGFPPGTAYACMAETMILTMERRFECYSLGRQLSLDKALEIAALAEKHGFELAGFRSFERPISEEQIARIRHNAGR